MPPPILPSALQIEEAKSTGWVQMSVGNPGQNYSGLSTSTAICGSRRRPKLTLPMIDADSANHPWRPDLWPRLNSTPIYTPLTHAIKFGPSSETERVMGCLNRSQPWRLRAAIVRVANSLSFNSF
jgi:hypothetical protein